MSTAQLDPIQPGKWDARKARHLLNRAGFGVPRERWERLAESTPEAAVKELVGFEARNESVSKPDFVLDNPAREEMQARYEGLDVDARREVRNEMRREERAAVERLKAWWLNRMLTTNRPLEEKLALFWHGHFATSAQKVQSSLLNFQINDVFRRNALGNFKTLTIEVGQTPAMLHYLDNARSNKSKPNENWARELMELFTMGAGNYSEDDIKNSARAFTGWSRDHERFQYREDLHDFGSKTFMGRTGNFDGWDIIDIIFEQPVTAEFIAGKLWNSFVYEDPEPELVKELGRTLRDNNYELKPLLERMFLAQAFYSDRAIGTQIKSPAQLVVQLCADLGIERAPGAAATGALRQLGQDLFYPPNVKGWDGGRAWINANALLFRYNLPTTLVNANGPPKRMMNEPQMNDEEQMMTARGAQNRGGRAAWTPQQLLAQLEFNTAGGYIDAMADRFLMVPLSAEQRATILSAMGASASKAMTPDSVPGPQLATALHLLLSTAEYQLC